MSIDDFQILHKGDMVQIIHKLFDMMAIFAGCNKYGVEEGQSPTIARITEDAFILSMHSIINIMNVPNEIFKKAIDEYSEDNNITNVQYVKQLKDMLRPN